MAIQTKFSNLGILGFMERIVEKHTKHYQSDFEIDKEMLREAANKQKQQDKTFIWLCRTAGTWCLNERNVFLKDTRENKTFNFYAEQGIDPVLAFVIEAETATGDTVIGNVYALDYQVYYKHVRSVSLRAETALLQYEYGSRIIKADSVIHGHPDMEYGKLISIQYQPHSQEELTRLLQKEWKEREHFEEGDPNVYISRI